MNIIDKGSGVPLVFVPGVQGRWEWMRPAIDALAAHGRVITFSLADEPTSGARFDAADGFANYVNQIRDALDACGIERAVICGMSYGGLIAAAFAARQPERTASLILVSALPPSWQPDARIRFYLRAPRLLLPLFLLASTRMHREIAAALPGWSGIQASARHVWTAVTHFFSPGRMARRVRMLADRDLSAECTAVEVPVLIITGEPQLDRVVPVSMTTEYARLWPHARVERIARTGHLGAITRPETFAHLVADFISETASSGEARRRIG